MAIWRRLARVDRRAKIHGAPHSRRILLAARPTSGGRDGARAFWFGACKVRGFFQGRGTWGPVGRKEYAVTDNSAFKKLVRARMGAKGENYTTARRRLLEETSAAGGDTRPERPAPLPLAIGLPAETFTAVVGAGGMTNLGLVMPSLISMARDGHRVVIAAHEGEISFWNLAAPFDFLVAAGAIGAEELATRWTSGSEEDRAYLRDLIEAFPMTFMVDRHPAATWIEALGSQGGKHAVLYVPDVQVDLPLSDWPRADARGSLSDFDLMPAQLTGLKSIAREAGAAVLGSHCMPARHVDGWRIVADIADDTIVGDGEPTEADDSIYSMSLEFHSRWDDGPQPHRRERARVDVGFDRWRYLARDRQKVA